jgi:hypothetical protein
MSGPDVRQYTVAEQDNGHNQRHRADIARRQSQRRSLAAWAVAGSFVAALVIAVGLPATGIAVYVAATLPFAFFS